MTEQEYDKEQLRILRNAFKAFDHDERGYIEHPDVSSILEILGQKLDDKATKALIKEVDKGNSGKLDFSQFCRLAARFVEVEEDANALASELKEAFRVYDKEGKGYLTVATLRGILHELDDKLTNTDLDMIIEEIDSDGSGTVDFDEFMQVMTGKNYYDLTLQHRFVFEPPQRSSVTIITPPSKCQCPSHRMRLHRRIESYFEHWFEQMWQQPRAHHHHPAPSTSHRLTASASATATHSSNAATNKTITAASASAAVHASASGSTATASSSISTSVKRCAPPPPPPVVKSTQIVRKISHVPAAVNCCCRTIFRPRFPKWVPILTLYRELIQNPFRQRGRYMITHY